MPITVTCPACGAARTVADRAAGRTIDCRSCAAPVVVPAAPAGEEEIAEFDPVDEAPAVAEPGPAPVAKKKKKKKKKDKPPAKPPMTPALKWSLIGGGAAAAVLLLVVGLVFALRDTSPKPDLEAAGLGWYKVEDHDGNPIAFFPGGKPKYERVSFNADNLAKLGGAKEALGMNWRMESWERVQGKRKYTAFVFTLPNVSDAPPQLAEQALARSRAQIGPGVEVKVQDDVKVNGFPAKRVAIQQGGGSKVSVSVGIGRNRIANAIVEGDELFDHTDPAVAAFFDNFTPSP